MLNSIATFVTDRLSPSKVRPDTETPVVGPAASSPTPPTTVTAPSAAAAAEVVAVAADQGVSDWDVFVDFAKKIFFCSGSSWIGVLAVAKDSISWLRMAASFRSHVFTK